MRIFLIVMSVVLLSGCIFEDRGRDGGDHGSGHEEHHDDQGGYYR